MCFVYASNEGSDESAHLHRLDWDLVARKYEKHQIAYAGLKLPIEW